MAKGERLTTEKVKKSLFDIHGNDYTLLNEYGDDSNNLVIKHEICGKIYKTVYSNIITRKRRCKYCFTGVRKTNIINYTEAKKRVESVKGYKLVTTEKEYKNTQTKVNILHEECGNILNMFYKNFVNNKARCKKCYHLRRSDIKTNKEFQEILDNKYGRNIYIVKQDMDNLNNKTTKVPILHNECGHVWNIDRFHIIDETNRCPICYRVSRIHSKSSIIIENYLKNNNIEYIMEYPLLGNIITKKDLISDFYLPEYNLIIEYDGKQHFKPMYNDEVKLSKQKARDLLKNKFLEESNYNWMRIHYRINKEEDIISVIEEKIKTISSEASI